MFQIYILVISLLFHKDCALPIVILVHYVTPARTCRLVRDYSYLRYVAYIM